MRTLQKSWRIIKGIKRHMHVSHPPPHPQTHPKSKINQTKPALSLTVGKLCLSILIRPSTEILNYRANCDP